MNLSRLIQIGLILVGAFGIAAPTPVSPAPRWEGATPDSPGTVAPRPAAAIPLVPFAAPWTSPFRVDPAWPHQLVNREGVHLLILNKTAWAYFGCQDPGGYLDRARAQGVNVIRVALEGRPYGNELNLELWPWGGTRAKPDWSTFDDAYWQRVEERVRLAGDKGIGLDVVLYMELHPGVEDIPAQQRYWNEILRRLGKYANILTWEIANEYTRNETFQDAAGSFFKEQDPQHRPVCSSDGTTDDAVWPQKPWMDLAINHTCTSSTPRHDLRDWYLAVARKTRAHGKPAWCNESGRERRHGNDDGVHRRKQGWLWYAAGCFWTWHSWDGCEGINDRAYRAPGEDFLRPMGETFRALPFWRMNPHPTVAVVHDPSLVQATLATAEADSVLVYCCTRETGQSRPEAGLTLRLPDGTYRLTVLNPADGAVLESRDWVSQGVGQEGRLALPSFTDDLAVRMERTARGVEIIACGGSRAVIFDADQPDGETPKLKWSWDVKEATNLPPRYQQLLVPLDECKLVRTNTQVLLTSSGGGAVLLDRPTRRPLFYAHVPMAHSAELLPGDRIAVALSTHAQGNRLEIYSASQSEKVLWADSLPSGHGVIWNPEHQRLYALGLSELRAYSLQDWASQTPSLRRENTWTLPGTSGHDLTRMSPDELLVTYHEGVSVFHIRETTFAPFPLLAMGNVKSINYDPRTRHLVYTRAEISWWTHHIYSVNPTRTFTFPDLNLYKARVASSPDPFTSTSRPGQTLIPR